MFYVFTKQQWENKKAGKTATFYRCKRKYEVHFALKRGDVVFKQEQGIPNPWWVRKVLKNGTLGKLKVI